MSLGTRCVRLARRRVLTSAMILLAAAWTSSVSAQQQQQNVTNNVLTIVGGVAIDAGGMLTNADRDSSGRLRQFRLEALQAIPEGMNQAAGLRKVSLRRLEAEINKCIQAGKPLPEARPRPRSAP